MSSFNPETFYVPVKVLMRLFGLTKAQIDKAGCLSRGCDFGIGYSIDDVWERCAPLIAERLTDITGIVDDDSEAGLKKAKLREEVSKLALANAEKKGTLIDAALVGVMASKTMKAVTDVLDSLPSQIRMENPDISQAMLTSVNDCLIKVRNRASEIDLGDVYE